MELTQKEINEIENYNPIDEEKYIINYLSDTDCYNVQMNGLNGSGNFVVKMYISVILLMPLIAKSTIYVHFVGSRLNLKHFPKFITSSRIM